MTEGQPGMAKSKVLVLPAAMAPPEVLKGHWRADTILDGTNGPDL